MSEEKQERPPILNIKMVPAGVELVIAALRKLPHEQVDVLVQEIAGQFNFQLQQLQAAAEKKPVAPAKKAVKKVIKK